MNKIIKTILSTLAITLFCLSVLSPLTSVGQIGGDHVYEFLTIPTSPRSAALGGSAMAINDGDISLANDNPSLLSKQTDGKLNIEYVNYISDINFGFTSYSSHYKGIGTFCIGLQYLNGGSFTEADENGYKYGEIGVSEFALNLSYAKSYDSIFSIGATLKPVYSQLAQYGSFGLVMDIGAAYTSEDDLFTASVLFKNMGAQITTYIEESAPTPFEIQAGISTRLAHAPFRFSIVAHNLQKPKLTYKQTNYAEPSNVPQENDPQEDSKILQDIMSHMIFGMEFIPTKSFFIRIGYSYMRQQELMLSAKPSIVGFSWGFGLRIKKMHLSYANVRYHLSAASNQLAITTNINQFLK